MKKCCENNAMPCSCYRIIKSNWPVQGSTPPSPLFNNLQSQLQSIKLTPFIHSSFQSFLPSQNFSIKTEPTIKNFTILIWPPHPTATTMPCTRWCYTRHKLIVCRTIGSYYALTVAVFQNILCKVNPILIMPQTSTPILTWFVCNTSHTFQSRCW